MKKDKTTNLQLKLQPIQNAFNEKTRFSKSYEKQKLIKEKTLINKSFEKQYIRPEYNNQGATAKNRNG